MAALVALLARCAAIIPAPAEAVESVGKGKVPQQRRTGDAHGDGRGAIFAVTIASLKLTVNSSCTRRLAALTLCVLLCSRNLAAACSQACLRAAAAVRRGTSPGSARNWTVAHSLVRTPTSDRSLRSSLLSVSTSTHHFGHLSFVFCFFVLYPSPCAHRASCSPSRATLPPSFCPSRSARLLPPPHLAAVTTYPASPPAVSTPFACW